VEKVIKHSSVVEKNERFMWEPCGYKW